MNICYVNPTILIRRPIAELIDRLSSEHEIAILTPKKQHVPLKLMAVSTLTILFASKPVFLKHLLVMKIAVNTLKAITNRLVFYKPSVKIRPLYGG